MSAFPIPRLIQDRDGCYSLDSEGGLTKRELFAALSLHAQISAMSSREMIHSVVMAGQRHGLEAEQYLAREAVKQADILLAELTKEQS